MKNIKLYIKQKNLSVFNAYSKISTWFICIFFIILFANPFGVFAYSPTAAAGYADQWWDLRNTPMYMDFTGAGGDCANFVSQCLIAGGLSLSAGPGDPSAYDGCIVGCADLNTNLLTYQDVTYYLRENCTSPSCGTPYPNWFTQGDVAIFGSDPTQGADFYEHTAIAVTTGTPLVDAHTNDRYHETVPFYYGEFYTGDFYHINSSVTQTCTNWAVNPSYQSVASGGGDFETTVSATGACSYNYSISVPWISFISYGSGGVLNYAVSSNSGAARCGYIYINDVTDGINTIVNLEVCQDAAVAGCSGWYTSPTTSANYSGSGGSGSFSIFVSSGSGCTYTASSSVSWINSISANSSTVSYNVDGNTCPSSSRTGYIYIYDTNNNLVATYTITEAGLSAPTVSASANPNPACVDQNVSLTATGNGVTYLWSGQFLNSTNGQSVSATPLSTGSYTYTVTAYANGCSTNSTVTLNVNTTPGAVSVSGGGTSCNSATLTASGGSGGTIYWQSTASGGTSTNNSSASQTVYSSGTYYFRAYNSCGWGTQGNATVKINTVPGAVTVSGGGVYCNSATLTASGGSGGTIYWQGTTSGGTLMNNYSPSQAVYSSGTYYFRAYNNCGWGTEGSATVTINTVPGAVSVSGGGTSCNSATLNASGGSGGTIYWQSIASGGTSTNNSSASQTVYSSGTYYFRAYNNCGWGTEGSAIVVINTAPGAVTVNGGGTSCNSATLNASGGSGGTIYWQNTTSGGTSMNNSSASQIVYSSGTYYFRSYNSCGWGTEGSATVTINAIPDAVTVNGGGAFCNNATLTASGGSGGTIYWQSTTSGGTSMNNSSVSQIVYSSGTYYFRAYNSCGWGTEGSATVTINTIPDAVTVNGGGAFCNNATLTISGGSGGTIYWQGTTSGGASFNNSSTSQTVYSSGTYYFRAYNSCGWGTEGSATVTINTTLPQPQQPDGPTPVKEGQVGVQYTTLPVNATLYVWTLPSGWQITSGQSTNSITVTVNGTGNVCVQDSNECGLSQQNCLFVDITTGLSEVTNDERMNIYPNPSNGMFTVDVISNKNDKISLNIFDDLGKLVYQHEGVIAGKLEMDLSGKAKGIYLIQVNDGERVYSQKIVIE